MARRIEVKVYEANGSTLVDTLESDNQRSFLKDLSETGEYSLQVKIGHADEALLTDGRIVRFLIDGIARWQGLVEPRYVVYADPQNREAGRVVNVKGRGTLALFEYAPIYPELGLGRISPKNRWMNPASADFDVSGWGSATAFHTQGTTTTTDPYYRYPKGFPDPAAFWIGPSDGVTSLPADIGFWWTVKTFTVPAGEGGDYRISIAVDDGVQVFVDGDEVYAESRVGLWGVTRQITVPLDEGTHRIAGRVENFDRPNPSTNATALVISVAKELAGGATLASPVVATDNTWKLLKVTTAEPGMTPGKSLKVFIDEAQANGYLTGVTYDFTATLDSDGVAWPTAVDVVFPVGRPILEVIRHLVAEGLCDVEMSATGLVLHAYVSKRSDLSATVKAEYATNIGRLAFSKTPPGFNTALSETAEGRWVERVDAAAVASWGKRGVHLALGSAPSGTAADRQADAFFEEQAEPVESITDMQLEEVNAVPFDDFDVGDVISATSSDGSMADCRVEAIRVGEDDAGNPVYAPELVRQ